MVGEYPRPGHAPVGGPQVGVVRLVRALAAFGVNVVVVAPATGSEDAHDVVESNVEIFTLGFDQRWSLLRSLRPWRHRVRSLLNELDIDVVHGQGLPGGIAASDAHARPTVATAHGNVRADTVAAYRGVSGRARAHLRQKLATAVVDKVDVVVGVHPDWRINLPRPPRRFVYVPSIIDQRFYDLERRPEPRVALFAGGTRAIKGWSLLAAAWPAVRKAVPEARLHLVGWPGGEAPPDVGARHRDSLMIQGWVSSAELASLMARASVLVIPSKFEASPILLAEAWALGLPVVATGVGGVPALAHGAAILVPPDSPEALAQGISVALAGGASLDRLIDEGRRRAERHRAEGVARAHADLYGELAGR